MPRADPPAGEPGSDRALPRGSADEPPPPRHRPTLAAWRATDEPASPLHRLRRTLAAWLFTDEPASPLHRFRRLLAAWTAAFVLVRLPHAEELYAREVLHDGALRRWLGLGPAPLACVHLLAAGLLAALALVLAGRRVRAAQLAALLLLALLAGLESAPPRAYLELALVQWLLLQCAPVAGATAPAWPRRLLLLQFSSVYVFAALAKLVQPAWRSGEAVARILGSPHYGDHLLSAGLALTGPAARWTAWAVILGELAIGVGLWPRRTRRAAVVASILLHAGMAASLRVSLLFHALMLAHLALLSRTRAPARGSPPGPSSRAAAAC